MRWAFHVQVPKDPKGVSQGFEAFLATEDVLTALTEVPGAVELFRLFSWRFGGLRECKVRAPYTRWGLKLCTFSSPIGVTIWFEFHHFLIFYIFPRLMKNTPIYWVPFGNLTWQCINPPFLFISTNFYTYHIYINIYIYLTISICHYINISLYHSIFLFIIYLSYPILSNSEENRNFAFARRSRARLPGPFLTSWSSGAIDSQVRQVRRWWWSLTTQVGRVVASAMAI